MKKSEKGQIKVVWVDQDADKIRSKMFNALKKALEFAKNKSDFVIFNLIRQKNMEEFFWELLPYGKYKLYLFFVAKKV